MKIFNKFSAVAVSAVVVVVVFGSVGSMTAHAATPPSLGTAASYSILAGSEVTNTGSTTISGDVGISPGIGSTPHYTGFGTVTLGGTIHDADAAALAAQNDKNTAYAALASQTCDTTYAGASKELAGEVLVPGVYCADRFFLSSGTLTLSGTSSDVWIFKSAADLIITGGSAAKIIFTGGGLACNVWWRVVSSATFDANSSLVGNILADTSITFAAGASLNGRALARTAAVTLSSNTITGPTCSASSSSSSSSNATLHVIKDVQNDDGDDQHADDFTLYVKLAGANVAGSPALGVASPGRTYSLAAGTYVVSEDEDSAYSQSFSGACDSNGSVTLVAGDDKTCTITNDDKKDAVKSVKKVTPKLPAAGVAPQEKNISWNGVALAGVLMLVSTSLVVVTRKHTV